MEKLIRRHPHVFGDQVVDDEKEVSENWETIKKKEGKIYFRWSPKTHAGANKSATNAGKSSKCGI